jgi:energy-coupling factor transporter ATP-binding protein EcfA2
MGWEIVMFERPPAADEPLDPFVQSRALKVFATELGFRLRAGAHLILYGPRGAGKSTLLALLNWQNRLLGAPCGLASRTSGLADIVAALEQAYPGTDIEGLGRRAARARLRAAADRMSGVLLLDHATTVTTAMLGFLRRLRGGIAGALLVADVDTANERERLRAWHIGAESVRMLPTSDRQIHRLLGAAAQRGGFPEVEAKMAQQIAHAARGRIGWINDCIERLRRPEYWREGRLHLAALCTDTEIALRQSHPGPRMGWR